MNRSQFSEEQIAYAQRQVEAGTLPIDVFQQGFFANGEMRAVLADEVHRRTRTAPNHRGHVRWADES